MKKTEPGISLIVVTYDRPEDCHTLVQQAIMEGVEQVVVVDNCSRIPIDIPASRKVTVIRSQVPLALGAARNIGILSSSEEIVAFVDDDAVLSQGWTSAIRESITNADVVGGLVEPIYLDRKPSWIIEDAIGRLTGYTNRWFFQPQPMFARNPLKMLTHKKEQDAVPGGNMAVKKQILRTIGLFDPRLGRYRGIPLGCDELELVVRARRAKAIITMNSHMRVFHKVHTKRFRLRELIRVALLVPLSLWRLQPHLRNPVIFEEESDTIRRALPRTFISLCAAPLVLFPGKPRSLGIWCLCRIMVSLEYLLLLCLRK